MPRTVAEQHFNTWWNATAIFMTVAFLGFLVSLGLVGKTVYVAFTGDGSYGDATQAVLALAVFCVAAVQVSLSMMDKWRKRVKVEAALL